MILHKLKNNSRALSFQFRLFTPSVLVGVRRKKYAVAGVLSSVIATAGKATQEASEGSSSTARTKKSCLN